MEIKCIKCGEIHNKMEQTFFTVQGNIYVGEFGGVVGNNFPKQASLNGSEDDYMFSLSEVNKSYFCINCLLDDIQHLKSEIIEQQREVFIREEDKLNKLIYGNREDDKVVVEELI